MDSVEIENEEKPTSMFEKLQRIPAIGIVFALFSGLFFATGSLIVKLVEELHPIELVVIRSSAQLVVYLPVILWTKDPILGANGERRHLFFRAFWGFISLGAAYWSYRMIPLGDASAVIFSSPVFVSVFAYIFLKEPCGIFNVITMTCSIAGVVLISRPNFLFSENQEEDATSRIYGTSLALCGSIGSALAFVSMRRLQKTSLSVVIFWFSLFVIIAGVITLLIMKELKLPTLERNYWLLLALGVCGTIGQFFLTLAFKIEAAGPVSLARTIDIVIAFIYQVILLQEELFWTSLLGAGIICTCVILCAVRKWKQDTTSIFWQIIFCITSRDVVKKDSTMIMENKNAESAG